MTAKELAQMIGVSTATVSLVINGRDGISDKTRARVLKRIKELGYEDMIKSMPEPEKTVEARNIPDAIGFVIFKDHGKLLGANSFFPLIIDGIESRARKHGFNVVFINIDKKKLKEQIHFISDANCKGFVIFATELGENDIMYFEGLGIPFVLFDNYYPGTPINTVCVDNRQGTYDAVDYLVGLGHKKIGYISSGVDITSFNERRFYAKLAMTEHGLETPDELFLTAGYPSQNAEQKMDEYLKSHKLEATAYLTDNDQVAAGVLIALKNNNYNVPEDVSIIGFDDRPLCEMITPKLTTVRLPRNDFGAEAVSRLIRIIDGRSGCVSSTRISGTLVIRETTGAPADPENAKG